MKTAHLTLALTAFLGLIAFAEAGRGCDDPYNYHITGEACLAWMGGGYKKVPLSYDDGGCDKTHQTSSVQCDVLSAIVNYPRVDVSGPFENIYGQSVWTTCTSLPPGAIMGIKYGKSNMSKPCDYCRTTP